MNLNSLLFLLSFSIITPSNSLIIDGEFNTADFFLFVRKFGFVKSEKHKTSYGYIYGNISSSTALKDDLKDVSVTFAVLDFHHFLEFYSNR